MHGLDPATDLGPLIGATLTFVGIGQHQVQLHFSGEPDCAVSAEGEYSVRPVQEPLVRFAEPPEGASALVALLGSHVERAEVLDAGTMRLTLNAGVVVEVYDSKAGYESYQVTLGDRLIVV